MSRLTKKPIMIPQGVTVTESSGAIMVRGPKGELRCGTLPSVTVSLAGETIVVAPSGTARRARMNAGTTWSLIQNAVEGVKEGFKKTLEIEGVGYKAAIEGNNLVLSIGYVSPVRFVPPEGVSLAVEKNQIIVSGTNKEFVGRAAAEIRALKKPEPYKGKGIHYLGEVIRRKAGKKATTTGGTG